MTPHHPLQTSAPADNNAVVPPAAVDFRMTASSTPTQAVSIRNVFLCETQTTAASALSTAELKFFLSRYCPGLRLLSQTVAHRNQARMEGQSRGKKSHRCSRAPAAGGRGEGGGVPTVEKEAFLGIGWLLQ